jgi:hypothetical protein
MERREGKKAMRQPTASTSSSSSDSAEGESGLDINFDYAKAEQERSKIESMYSATSSSSGPAAAANEQPTPPPSKPLLQPQQQPSMSDLLKPTEKTPEPRFLSLDNPVVFVAALLGGLVAVSIALH